jgi:hypothetical protein
MLPGMRMTVVNPNTLARGTGTAIAPVRPGGKASDFGAFADGRGTVPEEMPRRRPRLQVELVCQEGTRKHDPFWDAPRLLPAFVTQLLGQVLPQSAETRRPGAYAASACPSRILDARF